MEIDQKIDSSKNQDTRNLIEKIINLIIEYNTAKEDRKTLAFAKLDEYSNKLMQEKAKYEEKLLDLLHPLSDKIVEIQQAGKSTNRFSLIRVLKNSFDFLFNDLRKIIPLAIKKMKLKRNFNKNRNQDLSSLKKSLRKERLGKFGKNFKIKNANLKEKFKLIRTLRPLNAQLRNKEFRFSTGFFHFLSIYFSQTRATRRELKYTKNGNIEELLKIFKIDDFKKRSIKFLSGGQKQRLNSLLSFLSRPKLIFLDEIGTGLDGDSLNNIYDYVERYLSENDATLCLVSHNLAEIKRFADKVIVLDKGKLIVNKERNKVAKTDSEFETFLRSYYNF